MGRAGPRLAEPPSALAVPDCQLSPARSRTVVPPPIRQVAEEARWSLDIFLAYSPTSLIHGPWEVSHLEGVMVLQMSGEVKSPLSPAVALGRAHPLSGAQIPYL